jgi:hypothetical protein
MAMQRLGNTSQRERDLAIAKRVAEMTVARLEGRAAPASAPAGMRSHATPQQARDLALARAVAKATVAWYKRRLAEKAAQRAAATPRRMPSTASAKAEGPRENYEGLEALRRMWRQQGCRWSNESGEWRPVMPLNYEAVQAGIEGR